MVSVIIPVYNAEKYIKECLDSLLGQTYPDFEILCVDDGSKDRSLEILRKYEGQDDTGKPVCGRGKECGHGTGEGKIPVVFGCRRLF